MRKFLILFTGIIVSAFLACEKTPEPTPEPTPEFTIDKSTAEVNEVISFTNTSSNATSYLWDFGDGNTSGEDNPTHIYTTTGNFVVELRATGDGGTSSTIQSIEIIEPSFINKWIISEGTFDGEEITNLIGYFNVVDQGNYEAAFFDGINSGWVRASYNMDENKFVAITKSWLNFDGYSEYYFNDNRYWEAYMNCSQAVYDQWGSTLIGHYRLTVLIENGQLIWTSLDGLAVITYTKE
jgi:PKD repeat protein